MVRLRRDRVVRIRENKVVLHLGTEDNRYLENRVRSTLTDINARVTLECLMNKQKCFHAVCTKGHWYVHTNSSLVLSQHCTTSDMISDRPSDGWTNLHGHVYTTENESFVANQIDVTLYYLQVLVVVDLVNLVDCVDWRVVYLVDFGFAPLFDSFATRCHQLPPVSVLTPGSVLPQVWVLSQVWVLPQVWVVLPNRGPV